MLDRPLQLRVLQHCAASYPDCAEDANHEKLECDQQALDVQLSYLLEHELLIAQKYELLDGGRRYENVRITAKGMDFLEDDGGLSAILGVVTVRFHEDTLKALLESKIMASNLALPDKQKLTGQLRALPADAIKHLTLKLLDKAVEGGPQAIHWLETLIRNAAS